MASLTYNSTVPKIITYNGANVKTVTYNGTVIWTAAKDFTLQSAYGTSTAYSYYESATATSALGKLNSGAAWPWLILNETATNSRCPILYQTTDTGNWGIYWISSSYIKGKAVTHSDTVSTDDKIIVTDSGIGTYWDLFSDVDCKTIKVTMQPTQPFFIVQSGPYTSSSGETVYYVKGNNIKDSGTVEVEGYFPLSGVYRHLIDLSTYNIVDLV